MNNRSTAITRRQFLQASLASSALMALPGMGFGFDTAAKKPNFIIIYCDDLGYGDLGCYGAEKIKTPRIDRMASEGLRFSDFYSAAPVCTPSRAALMTGCYPLRVSLPTVLNTESKVGISDYEKTIGDILKTQGYATACIGKWHLGYQRPFLPTRHGFDYYFGIPYSNDMSRTVPIPLMRNEEIVEQPAVQETLTERYTREAIRFITENKDRPFFLYLPHTFPHVPLYVSERFSGKSRQGLYGDVVECIDWSTGEILDTLKRLGIDNNTMVIFSSDNGPWMVKEEHGGSAGPLRGGKAQTWEGGMREPCIMRWPGMIPAGKTCSELATTMDIMPTFARLAGAEVPADRIIDGKDIWSLISCKPGAVSPHEAFFYYRVGRLEAVRSGKWKLILPHKEVENANELPTMLFDLSKDIGETTNLAARYPGIVKRLEAHAQRCREDLGDTITRTEGKNRRQAGTVEK